MLWRYTTSSGLTVFTYLVDLTVVTVAIPYLFSACAQLTYLVSRRRPVQGWLLARDLSISRRGGAVLAVGHVRRRVLGGVPGHGRRAGRDHPLRLRPGPPRDTGAGPGAGRPCRRGDHAARTRRDSHDASACNQRWASCGRPSSTGRAWSCPGSPRRTSATCCSTTCCGRARPRKNTTCSPRSSATTACRCTTSGSCWPRRWSCPRAGRSCWTGCAPPRSWARRSPARSASCSRTSTGRGWPSTWSAGCSRPTCGRCGPRA